MDELDFYDGTKSGSQIDTTVATVGAMLDPDDRLHPYAIATDGDAVAHYQIMSEDASVDTETKIPTLSLVRTFKSDAITDARTACFRIRAVSVSSLPLVLAQLATTGMTQITEDFTAVAMNLSNPSAQTSDWKITTATRRVTISGSINGTTDILLYIADPYDPAVM